MGPKQIRFKGTKELAYLHTNQFNPDPTILADLGVPPLERYVLLRFVSWNASHDIGHKGISLENKKKIVNEYSKYAKVFISSEIQLPHDLLPFKISIPPEQMHHVIAYAALVFGESATMVSEAAVLGVPGIYIDNTGRYYTTEQEQKYGLVFNYSETQKDQLKAIAKGIEILTTPGIGEQWQRRRQLMLKDKIDLTAFMIWFIENYPQSFKIMKDNPEYQARFK
jgi:hypothetical protein